MLLCIGCDSGEREPPFENFEVIEEPSAGDDSGGESLGEVSACVIAPRFGTLAIVRYLTDLTLVGGDPEVVCTESWPYQSAGYREANLEIVAHLAGPELTEATISVKGFTPGMNASRGDLAIANIWNLDDYVLRGDGYDITPSPDAVVPVDDPGRPDNKATLYTFARTVEGLRNELQTVMSSPLPEKCPGFSGTVPSVDEERARELVYASPGEEPQICSAESEQTQPDPNRDGFRE